MSREITRLWHALKFPCMDSRSRVADEDLRQLLRLVEDMADELHDAHAAAVGAYMDKDAEAIDDLLIRYEDMSKK